MQYTMNHMRTITRLMVLWLCGTTALANNIEVSNAAIVSKNGTEMYAMVQFDISWDNSWRGSGEVGVPFVPYNWDAAWVFIKYRVSGGDWKHAWLNNTGHSAPSGGVIETGLLTAGAEFNVTTNPALGVFLFRNAIGAGDISFSNVQLRWNYGANGVTNEDVVDVVVYAVEMVYVTQDPFYLGSGGTESGCFTNGSFNKDQVWSVTVPPGQGGSGYDWDDPPTVSLSGGGGSEAEAEVSNITLGAVRSITVTNNGYGYFTAPTVTISGGSGSGATATAALGSQGATTFQIIGEGAIDIERASGKLWGTTQNTGFGSTIGPPGTLPAAFPKGYKAFYCMKHEITQQQYVDFLNSLTTVQATARYPNQTTYRHAITVTEGIYGTSLPDVACNYLSWSDVVAILDWMALRPMTELEFEKASKGTALPSANQYPWGTGAPTAATGLSNAGSSDEEPSNSSNSAYNICSPNCYSLSGPIRVGAFAGDATNRETSGASYYGILELSGNVREWVVGVGKETGRNYTGLHGDGLIDVTHGTADVPAWPSGSFPDGIGFRGGDWMNYHAFMQVSDRTVASMPNSRQAYSGGRGVRTAP